MGPEFFEEIIRISCLNIVLVREPAALGSWSAFAGLLKSRESIQSLSKGVAELFRRRGGISNGLNSLPLSTLSDFRWFAQENQDNDLKAARSALLGIPKASAGGTEIAYDLPLKTRFPR
ncbi:MAG TPA: hypothetical protein VG734_23460 [Lacunisphaera sp.]|nr:hypothetical protein [Lacunisphaera sp.]